MPRDLAIDLGTANTLVYARGRGVVLNEPSVIALNTMTQEVLAVGRNASRMIGRTPSYIVAVRPLRQGAITDFDITQSMIKILLEQVGVSRVHRARVVVCVPSAITPVERRAVTEAVKRAGATEARLLEQPLAAAIGASLPVNKAVGSMVVDIGGGTTETALLSMGGVVTLEAVRVGSFDIDDAIRRYLHEQYGLAVGEPTAEETKKIAGSASPTRYETGAVVKGRELTSGMPRTATLTPAEIRDAIEEPVGSMINSAVRCLAQSPPELAQDIILHGIHLVGGGGLLRGMDLRLARATSVKVRRVESPLEAVVLGAGKYLESMGKNMPENWFQ